MCLAFIAIEQHCDYPLLLLFNRDESYSRASLPAHWWEDKAVFAGRDLLRGGTWAAIDRNGKFAMITFVRALREDRTPEIPRGEIVPSWIESENSAEQFLKFLEETAEKSLGYNLIFGDQHQAFHYNNRSGRSQLLTKGVYGVSNADLGDWFKVEQGIEELGVILKLDPSNWSSQCLALLNNSSPAPDSQVQITGLDPEREKQKSAIFVQLENYGTLASSVIRFAHSGHVEVVERSFTVEGKFTVEVSESFALLK